MREPMAHGAAARKSGDDDASQVAEADEQEVASEQPAEEAVLETQRREPGTILSIEDLVGAKVVTRGGESRGTVVDVRTSPPPRFQVIGLIVGSWSWLERLRIATRLRKSVPQASRLQEVRWNAVDRWDGLRIILRDDPRPREIDLEPAPTGEIAPDKPLEPQKREEPGRG
jgi:hypothetical protein